MNFSDNINKIEAVIGYTFKDKSLLRQAFTRTSYCNEHRAAGQSNEVLEFFGDSILSAAIITLFVRRFAERSGQGIRTDFAEGDFTVIRSKLSDKKNLSEKIKATGLQRYLLVGDGDSKLGVADEPSVMEDLFESIVGAVYIDCNMNMERVIAVVSGLLDIEAVLAAKTADKTAPTQSAKNRLQEWCADKAHRLPPPVYKTVGESGPEHKKTYERACYIGERMYAVGRGKNQKAADADAAEKALAILTEEHKRASAPRVDADAIAKLKAIAKARKISTPAFRDLGETDKSTATAPEFSVLCSFCGIEETGIASDKAEARVIAADKILKALTKKEENEKNPPVQKKKRKPLPQQAKTQNPPPRVTKNAPHKTRGAHPSRRKNTRIT